MTTRSDLLPWEDPNNLLVRNIQQKNLHKGKQEQTSIRDVKNLPTGLSVLPSRRQRLEFDVVLMLDSWPAPAPAEVEDVNATYVAIRPCLVVHENVEENANQEDYGTQAEPAEEKSCSVTATQHLGDDLEIVVRLD